MAIKIFTIPAKDPAIAEEEMNRFLRGHRAVSIQKQFLPDLSTPLWSFAVEYIDPATTPASPTSNTSPRKNKVDYREVLSEDDFAVYSALRDWRKQKSESEGVPVYALFTNEQLAGLARTRPATLSAVQSIDGIGEVKSARYGKELLACIPAVAESSPVQPEGEQ